MEIYLGADHRGFYLKEGIKAWLQSNNYKVIDCGNTIYNEQDDYPDFAHKVATEVSKNPEIRRGIVFCGSGVGVDIEVNRHKGIRSALVLNAEQIASASRDDQINVLAVPSDFIAGETLKKIIYIWLSTVPSGEMRHKRRIKKIDEQH